MTSIIRADNISTVAGTGNISLNTGNKIVSPDTGAIVAPGMVIQTKYAKLTTVIDLTSSTFTDIGLSVAITPKFSNSIIYVTARLSTFWQSSTSNTWGGGHRIVRDSTVIDDTMGDGAGPLDQWWNLPVTAATYKDYFMQANKSTMDSPGTTNQLIYKVQSAARVGTLKLNYGSPYAPHSLLVVQEIAQ